MTARYLGQYGHNGFRHSCKPVQRPGPSNRPQHSLLMSVLGKHQRYLAM
jgi:hypothetical protein